MADVEVKDINLQPVASPTYYVGVNAEGKAIRVAPVVIPVQSVVGLTGTISQAGLRSALGLGAAAYVGLGTTVNDAAYGNHTHTPASIGAEPSYGTGTTSQYLRGDKTWQTLNKAAVGLSAVDNTADADKPISSATATALSGKEPTIVSGSPTQWWRGDKQWAFLAKTDVGLGNVDNTSDANKPVSTATQTALDGKNAAIQFKKDTTSYGTLGAVNSVKFTGAGVTLSETGNELTVTVADGAGAFDGNLDANLNITGAARRITGDFSNASFAARVAFQSSTVNGNTVVQAIPNGTSYLSAFSAANSSDIANASLGILQSSADAVRLSSTAVGTGQLLPIILRAGNADRQTILPTGEVGIGVTPVVGQGTMQVQNVNGAATSGFRNKIINGCCRISRKGSGAASLGWNQIGADGISTFIGGWSAVTGSIGVDPADSSVTSSGGTHFTNITAATGGAGYIQYIVRIEAADALELAGRPITTSARITSLTKQIDDVVIYIMKANTLNNFGAGTYVANSAGLGPVSANTTKDVSFSTTLTTADCTNGLQIELHCYYNSAVTAAFHCFIADLQCCIGSQRMPFEPRPIAIEEQLRRRYYQKQSVRVNTSSNWTCFPIGMVKTPTITGGGSGFTSTGTTADTLMCYQTTAAAQTLILDAEL